MKTCTENPTLWDVLRSQTTRLRHRPHRIETTARLTKKMVLGINHYPSQGGPNCSLISFPALRHFLLFLILTIAPLITIFTHSKDRLTILAPPVTLRWRAVVDRLRRYGRKIAAF